MSNPNSPTGLTPVRNAGGGTMRTNRYFIAGALASNIYRGSAVIPTNTSKQINVAAAGNQLQGVFKGCFYVDAGGNTQFRPYWGSGQTIQAGSVVEAQVFDDPATLFAVQASGTGLTALMVGSLADLVIGTGSQLTGNSGDLLDITTVIGSGGGSGAGTQLKILELLAQNSPQQPGSLNAYGQYAKALVQISKHYLGPTLTTI